MSWPHHSQITAVVGLVAVFVVVFVVTVAVLIDACARVFFHTGLTARARFSRRFSAFGLGLHHVRTFGRKPGTQGPTHDSPALIRIMYA
jgi:hypothetical protein